MFKNLFNFHRNKEVSKPLKEKRQQEYQRVNSLQLDSSLSLDEKINSYRSQLGSLAKHSFKSTLKMYYATDASTKEVDIATRRFYENAIITSIIVFVFCKIFFKISTPLSLLFALLGILFMYGSLHNKLKNRYIATDTLKQQGFNTFARLVIPYLNGIKRGEHMYNIFSQVKSKIANEVTHGLLVRLMAEMTQQPSSRNPFSHFSRDASGTDTSDLFMNSLYDMTQGSYSTSTVKSLAKQIDEIYRKVTHSIKSERLKELGHIFAFFFGMLLIIMFTYLGLLIVSQIKQMMQQ
ncbi:hypothetical protein DY052_09140 [Apilactobacillus timberlakei]|uniref:hypothetical protein n=1 Tax=Apilactobacillus timberlakei TaxID=2008380 RepID=UPI001127F137|nr:hypothetical protein [Apilactobacillus timberlakei]TPR12813.1 hypothetical protein DY052_09140 [Apilactobacillus timberlakei]